MAGKSIRANGCYTGIGSGELDCLKDPYADTLLQEPFQYLLDSHWCWIQPLWNFVYRPAFTRLSDLAIPDDI